MDLTNLNDIQQKAVECTEGPILVIAGAGSGKTKLLTNKVAYLIKNKEVTPSHILAITFTNKAAKEMKDRIFHLIGDEAKYIQISTFHSFGYKILRDNYELCQLGNNFTILDETDVLSLIKRILKQLNLDDKHYVPKIVRSKISNAKNEMISCQEYEKYCHTSFDETVCRIYKEYTKLLKNSNAVDFDDLLLLPISLLKSNPDVLKFYQEKYRYILIDEYQDTNTVQYILTNLIASKYQNICVVGDIDQSIYAFRGANYQNILNFEKDFSKVKTFILEENYRSTKNILALANSLIKNNKSRKEKNLWTSREEGTKPRYYRLETEKDESSLIVSKIKEFIYQGVSLDEIAVLYRTNAQSRIIEEKFLMENIPYQIVGSYAFYNRKEIKDLVSYLKLIHNEKDDSSLLRCINTPRRGIGDKTIEILEFKSSLENKSIFEVIDSGKELKFKEMILDFKEKSKEISLTELVDYILDKSGFKESLELDKTIESSIRLENIEEFKSITLSFDEKSENITLEDFLMEISLVSNSDQIESVFGKVSLMTIHSAKGLEFEVVLIAGVEEGLIPHTAYGSFINSFETDLEEERRLFYVAITRAKKHLIMTSVKMRMLFGQRKEKEESTFIEEIEESLFERIGSTKKINYQEMYYVDEDLKYNVGDLVKHKDFGEGIIVGIDKNILTISFPYPFLIKKIMKNHVGITKINK